MTAMTQPINLKVVMVELDFSASSMPDMPSTKKKRPAKSWTPMEPPKLTKRPNIPSPPLPSTTVNAVRKRSVNELVEELLDELYADQRDWSSNSAIDYGRGSTSAPSLASTHSNYGEQSETIEQSFLEDLGKEELQEVVRECEERISATGERLARCVRARDRLRRQQRRLCAAFTVLLRHITGDKGARFGVVPGEGAGEGGFAEWLHAMRLVARLPAGVPHHFRKKLWLTLSDRHLTARGVDWPSAERACFRGTALPDDAELGAQILKDLHRTGCSLFCGTEGRENQAMLRRVLLAYARWNKEVGYCQGFNMIAAIILEVMDKSESDSLKVMIYLVEAVLPEGYFADDLRGLSADMAAFRDLLRLRLPRLAQHMDHLQRVSDGGGVEPPLPDVFTMQWFLTLYATWLPREALLRIWDLVLLDGNEVLLLTALAIWDLLQDRILSARSADEFYSCMGGGAGAVYEAGESLVGRVVAFGSAPELPRLRSIHRYRVAPPAPPTTAPVCQPPLHSAMQTMTKKGLRLFYSEDEGDSSDDGNKMALATVIPRREDRSGAGDRLSLDIGALKRQYARLRERQRQAHVILAAACARHAAVGVPTSPTSLTVNNLLLGKSAIVSSRGRRLGPPPGAVPPSRSTSQNDTSEPQQDAPTNDTISWTEEKSRKSLSRRNSVKWKDIKKDKSKKKDKDEDRSRKASIDFDEAGDGIIVSEREANEIVASVRSRNSSESSTYSSHSATSSDTSLCDENERASDSEPELPNDDKVKVKTNTTSFKDLKLMPSPIFKDSKVVASSELNEDVITEDIITDDIVTEDIITHSPKHLSEMELPVKPVTSITDYLDSAAGEPLRTYIDGFESKLKDSKDRSYKISPIKEISPFSPKFNSESEILQRLTQPHYEEMSKSSSSIRPSRPSSLSSAKEFGELSPIELSPCVLAGNVKSPYDYDFLSNFRRPITPKPDLITRPPDIIDSLTMYPNFVPDIDLSDKNVSDIDSTSHSPAESIVVSEDEPPIPLKIDKYFEHSPEFFGARVTNAEIPSRRAAKRNIRIPKKPDSLTLHNSHNEELVEEFGRASSLPQSLSFTKPDISPAFIDNASPKHQTPPFDCVVNDSAKYSPSLTPKVQTEIFKTENAATMSPKDYILRLGRKNSERALQIIQENSKILSRILTKQSISEKNQIMTDSKSEMEKTMPEYRTKQGYNPEKTKLIKTPESPLLKESTSDSLIGYRKNQLNDDFPDKNEFLKVRPISIDDPFSLNVTTNDKITVTLTKTPSTECLGNKTDIYGWENKGFLGKCDYTAKIDKIDTNCEIDYKNKSFGESGCVDVTTVDELKLVNSSDWTRYSGESKTSVTLPSSVIKETTTTYDHKYTSDDYKFPFSSKYNDYVISKASDICSENPDEEPKICKKVLETENSQVSEFAHLVTSSISFTYEPSADDDSPIGAKSNSSDTLCQIASLDQVSTPISPKIFPKETPTQPKEFSEKNERNKLESDDTCSAITSLIETDTLSSISYPRSPSTGSYHPFPTRASLRMPKELGVRLGMYPKDAMSSSPK